MLWAWWRSNSINIEYSSDALEGEANQVISEEPRETVRASLFNTLNTRLSLAIPVDWEGDYRSIESGNTVQFIYIGAPEKPQELFSISYFLVKNDEDLPAPGESDRVIAKNNAVYFVYNLSTTNYEKDIKDAKYQQMVKDIKEILKTVIIK